MKVGDVVKRGDEFGIATDATGWGLDLYFGSCPEPWVVLVEYEALVLTTRQRAIVDAAIAAEALRRIG